jgi:hypothetical protein
MTPRTVAKGTAFIALAGLIVLWIAWVDEVDPDPVSSYGRLAAELDSTAWGRWLMTSVALYMLGISLSSSVAAFRNVPALALDDDGITAWALFRTRHVPWGDVVSIGFAAGRRKAPGLVVVRTRGPTLRISAQHFEMPADEAAAAVRSWIAENRGLRF